MENKEKSLFENKTILLTGGTGSFGNKFTEMILKHNPKSLRIYSRGEYNQYMMDQNFKDEKIRFLIGEESDRDRLYRTMNGVDIVPKASPCLRYNPIEAVRTNMMVP